MWRRREPSLAPPDDDMDVALGEGNAAGGSGDADPEDAAPGARDSQEDDRIRPGAGTPEGDTDSEGQDDGHGDRSFESLYHEERRRRLKSEDLQDELTARLLSQTSPQVSSGPPHTQDELKALLNDGKVDEYHDGLQANLEWQRGRDREDFDRRAEERENLKRLTGFLGKEIVGRIRANPKLKAQFSQQVETLRSEFGKSLSDHELTLLAASKVGIDGYERGGGVDLRTESDRRENRGKPRRDPSRRAPSSSGDPTASLTDHQISMLRKAGLYDKYTTPLSDPAAEARRVERLRNVLERDRELTGGVS